MIDAATAKPIDRLLSRLHDVAQVGERQWSARCPAHDDQRASLSVAETDGGIVGMKCHAGCETADVLAAVGLTMADLFPHRAGDGKNGKPRIVAVYDYRDESGAILYQAVRMQPKDFRQRTPKPGGGWSWSTKDVRKALYRLPELLAADPVETVFIVEGEKDCDRLASLGLVATTNVGGAGKWRKEYNEHLRGRRVVILPDNDDPGRKHAADVARNLHGVAASIRVVELPNLPQKGDVSDWLDAGGTVAELRRIVEDTPEWTPATAADEDDDARRENQVSNVRTVLNEDGEEESFPRTMVEVIASISDLTDGWPRRIGNTLFVHEVDDKIDYLDRPAALFGWLAKNTGVVEWHRKTGCVSKEEVFAELQRTSQRYHAVEVLPHYPPIDGLYYTCSAPTPGDGASLDELLGFFCFDSDLDRQLGMAAFATSLWGGPSGTRPAQLITAPSGRGKGKSYFTQRLGQLYGGVVDVSAQEDIGVIKQRLLSPDAATKRIVTLDNVKTMRFSCAELEALITANTISGKQLYVGEGSRPNLLTWIITLNGASLSTDMAQRVVEIKLGEPRYEDGWDEHFQLFWLTWRRSSPGLRSN